MISYLKKLKYLMSPSQVRSGLLLFLYMLIGMVLETLGVSLVIPFFTLLLESDVGSEYPFIQPLLSFLGDPSQITLIFYGMSFFLLVYFVKTFFLTFLLYSLYKFIYGLQESVSRNLFSMYLKQPYAFHLTRNSAQLIRNATTEVGLLVSAIGNTLTVSTEFLVLLGITCLLIYIEPAGTIVVILTMVLLGGAFIFFTRDRLKKWGEQRLYHDGLRVQHLQQGFGGAKELKLLGREDKFSEAYTLHNSGSATAMRRQAFMTNLPRLYIELFAVSAVVIFMSLLIFQSKPLESLVPIMGLFAVAAFRIMPSINRIVSATQTLHYSYPALHILYQEISSLEGKISTEKGVKHLELTDKLEVENLYFKYENKEKDALKDINLNIEFGSCIGIIGPSGSGKSTLLDLLLGLLTPSKGIVKVSGIDIQKNLRGWQKQIGYVPQDIYLTDSSLRENIAFGINPEHISERKIEESIISSSLNTFVDSLEEGLDTNIGERGVLLSGGQQQRIGIARALYHDPEVLVFDEATSSLDIEIEKKIMDDVHNLTGIKTIVIVTHRLSTVSKCDYLYELKEGKIINEGSYKEVVDSVKEN